jgi:hypothetical protein
MVSQTISHGRHGVLLKSHCFMVAAILFGHSSMSVVSGEREAILGYDVKLVSVEGSDDAG